METAGKGGAGRGGATLNKGTRGAGGAGLKSCGEEAGENCSFSCGGPGARLLSEGRGDEAIKSTFPVKAMRSSGKGLLCGTFLRLRRGFFSVSLKGPLLEIKGFSVI